MPAGEAPALFERLEDQRFLLGAHAAQGADAAIARGLFEVLERPNAELAVEGRDGLGADALEVQQIQDGWRKFSNELTVICARARVGDFANTRREVLADARDFPQSGDVEEGELIRMVGDDVGGVAIRANLERVLALDFEEIGDLSEKMRDCGIIQPAGLPCRCGSRGRARPPASERPRWW